MVGPWFWSKIGNFVNLFFEGYLGEENVFYDILERENVFVGNGVEKDVLRS